MSKSIKLKNDTYLDTKSIMHNRKLLADIIYPVGSIYISVNNANPSTYYGGTWEQIEARYLMGAGRPSKNSYDGFGQITDEQIANFNFAPATLGELTHTLTDDEIPSHAVTFSSNATGNFQGIYDSSCHSAFSVDQIGNRAHNNLPPTLVVYMWKRIA